MMNGSFKIHAKTRPIDFSKTIINRKQVKEDEAIVKEKLYEIKQNRINSLNDELNEGKNALIEFYNEVTDFLGLREVNDTKAYHMKPEEILAELEKIIIPLLNIEGEIKELVKTENKLISNDDEEILSKKLLSDLRSSMRESLQIDFLNELITLRQDELNETQSLLTRRHYEMIDSYKEELRLLLKIVDFRDKEIAELRKEIDKKNEMIKGLKKKLLSMVVLEFKAGELEKKYKKDLDMLERKYQKELDEIRNVRKFDPNLLMQQLSKQEELKEIKMEIFKEQKKRQNFMEQVERKKNRIERALQTTEEKIKEREGEINKLKNRVKFD